MRIIKKSLTRSIIMSKLMLKYKQFKLNSRRLLKWVDLPEDEEKGKEKRKSSKGKKKRKKDRLKKNKDKKRKYK